MATAANGEIEIYFEVHGSGPPLLNITGTGNDLRVSRPDVNPLNANFTVCHYDQRGLGRTRDRRDIEGAASSALRYTMADYAQDAAAMIAHMGWERAHVVGTSFGGMVAQRLAVRHPEVVSRVVLACTSAGGAGGSSADLLALSRLPLEEANLARGSLYDTRNDLANGVFAPGMEQIIQWMSASAKAPAAGDADVALPTIGGQRRQLEARAGHDCWLELGSIIAPTLVIGGRFDGIAPPANLEALADAIPTAELAWCDGGHIFMIQDRTSWTTILEFLQRQ